MNRLFIGVLVTLCLSSMRALPQSQTPNGSSGSLTGAVVDAVTGLPIEGVQVTAMPGQPATEEGLQSLLRGENPNPQSPQITKVIPAFALGGRTLTPERTAYSVQTDSRGRFVLKGLAAERYSLSLRANGYNFQVLGERPDSLTWLPIAIQNNEADVGVIRMSPYPRITGRIVDLDDRPIAGIPVYLLNSKPSISVDGERRFRAVSDTATDTAGRYAFEKIAAGHYYVAAGSFAKPELMSFRAGTTERNGVRVPAQQPYPYTYHPGVPDIGLAGQIDAPAGIAIELSDFVVKKPELRSIQGQVVDFTTGKPPVNVRVVLNALVPFIRAGGPSNEILTTKYDRTTGIFEAKDLIPGTYRVDAMLPRQSSGDPTLSVIGGVPPGSSFQIVELINSDIRELLLGVPATSRVAGKVTVTDGKPFPLEDHNLSIPFQLMLRPIRPLQPSPLVTSVSVQDGTFQVESGLEGRYRFSIVPLRDNYYVSEAWLDGVRITNGVLDFSRNAQSELNFTLSPGGEVQGVVLDKQGQPVKQAQGILLPDPLLEAIPFYATVTANGAAQFNAHGVPPGNYKLYFWEHIEPSQFFDRELLARSAPLATRVRVEKGAPTSVTARIIETE